MDKKNKLLVLFSALLFISCNAQMNDKNYRLLGAPCEGCEAVLEFNSLQMNNTDTLPGFESSSSKVVIKGIIYESDGKTLARDIIMYLYHTNEQGVYQPGPDAEGWEQRHGQFRGWIKTGKDGKYSYYTSKPGGYGNLLPHMHAVILEPDGTYYYIDEFRFMEDEGNSLDHSENSPRGGSGLIRLENHHGMLTGSRDIVLGLNVPDYED